MENKGIEYCEHIRVGTIFDVEKLKDGVVIQKITFHNLVLNCGLDALAESSLQTLTWRCHVGTGDTLPVGNQTSLISEHTYLEKSHTSNIYSYQYTTGLPIYAQMVRTFTFAIGSTTTTLNEVGLSSTANVFLNRALFSSPIVVAADEQIRVTATVRLYSDLANPEDSKTGTFTFDVTETNWTKTSTGSQFWSQPTLVFTIPLGTFFCLFETVSYLSSTNTLTSYVSGNYYAIRSFVWASTNFTGTISTLYLSANNNGNARISLFTINPTISKSNTEEVTFVFKRTWGRY